MAAPPQLVAHRGYAARYPENTLPALEAALDLGTPFVELDVQVTADGVPVVLHDEDLLRTTGHPRLVTDLPAAEVARLEAAETTRFGTAHAGTRVPTLAQFTERLAARAAGEAFIEIKGESLRRFGVEAVVTAVLDALGPVRDRCIVIGFDRAAIATARRLGAARIGWVLPGWDEEVRAAAETLAPDDLFVDHRRVPVEVDRLWPGPWRWTVYEIVTAAAARHWAGRGADLIETMDCVGLAAALAAPHAGETPR